MVLMLMLLLTISSTAFTCRTEVMLRRMRVKSGGELFVLQ